jgi:hypothetical protein
VGFIGRKYKNKERNKTIEKETERHIDSDRQRYQEK